MRRPSRETGRTAPRAALTDLCCRLLAAREDDRMKMLILRGKAGYYDDTDWPDGALHEQPALDYATRRGYDGTVLPMPGRPTRAVPSTWRR